MSTSSWTHAAEAPRTETPRNGNGPTFQEESRLKSISQHMYQIIKLLGEDPDRQGLIKTPDRCAQALWDLTVGYAQSVDKVVNGAIFDVDATTQEMVIVRDIEISSLCEHHMLPFTGKVSHPPQSSQHTSLYLLPLGCSTDVGER